MTAKKKQNYPKKSSITTTLLKVVKPKTLNQSNYLRDLLDIDLPIVIGTGPAGTGKTQLAIYAAAKSLYDGTVRRIILARPVVEAGENLGFLPGTLEEKIDPYMRPLFDAFKLCFRKDTLVELLNREVIEVCPLAYVRGRTFKDAYVILDEAQNATKEQVKMVLTRLGHESNIALTGDPSQSDLHIPNGRNGLAVWSKILEDEDYTSVCQLTSVDNQRRPEVALLLQKYYENTWNE